jgi:hypothetical protein
MSTNKRKQSTSKQTIETSQSPQQQLAQARQAHAQGDVSLEEYIWSAMQCYAAEMRSEDTSD